MRSFIKSIVFSCILIVCFCFFNCFFQPIWNDKWNNYNTIYGYYMEPDNSVQTLFLGSSVTATGINPIQLYNDYGISAYNMGTESQPLVGSYNLLKEVYGNQGKMLKNVFLEVSMLRRTSDEASFHKSVDGMKTNYKLDALTDYNEGSLYEGIVQLFPIYSYHTRWASLDSSDYEKMIPSKLIPKNFTRGYSIRTDAWKNFYFVPDYYITDSNEKAYLEPESIKYFELITDFCTENDLNLVLYQTPRVDLDIGWHETIKELAEKNDLAFLDFNSNPLLEEIDYLYAMDSFDGFHPNYSGAEKITRYIGHYISEELCYMDCRGEKQFDYLVNESEKYKEYENKFMIAYENDLITYIDMVMKIPNTAVIFTVYDEASSNLNSDLRTYFLSIGMNELSDLGYGDSYVGVIVDGNIVFDHKEIGHKYIDYLVKLPNDVEIEVKSGVLGSNMISSCILDEEEYSKSKRGINIIVYDYRKDELVDSTVFDTYLSPYRFVDLEDALDKELSNGKKYYEINKELKEYYGYLRRCENAKKICCLKEKGAAYISNYLEIYAEDGYCIILSVMDEASSSLNENTREWLKSIGLCELSEIGYWDSYAGIIDGGKIIEECRSHDPDPIVIEGLNYKIVSGGLESGNVSSILYDNIEYSENRRGVNLVVFDRQLNEVIVQKNFDTYSEQLFVPEL